MEMAESLIKQGKAYVDDTPKQQMKDERAAGTQSKRRNNTVEENLSLWREMINGTEIGMQSYVRGKLDMQDPNKALRDPVYYRCNTDPHHRVGSKYKVYPTYDFASQAEICGCQKILPRHKKYEGAGNKATTFTSRIWLEYADATVLITGQEVTLMDWGNTIIKEIKTENGIITQLVGELHLEGSVKLTKLKLTWLPDIEDLVSLSLVEFDYLITKKKVINKNHIPILIFQLFCMSKNRFGSPTYFPSAVQYFL